VIKVLLSEMDFLESDGRRLVEPDRQSRLGTRYKPKAVVVVHKAFVVVPVNNRNKNKGGRSINKFRKTKGRIFADSKISYICRLSANVAFCGFSIRKRK
jgi:hypothetical protein